ncbi:MAG: hypothetical protein F2704_02490 [Actinobacteria bacterium]|uniref:Unannotated protein n=1 Tax=freshwater metagenome TaxID=449393 RepID=A0A6J7HXE6_9ZZZZ|nr:hypothetical protein [Actinomycetota bacterium]MSX24899.1 hypothetical protein [Actinomycetota bacterium]MSY45869.1 hypothetical protein [Actinomycetota bacterium]MSY57123.1 hypothetical protein [Actinomycetota bacterium]MTB00633.1 hypothetical protein [Actinomycetota bacterium]
MMRRQILAMLLIVANLLVAPAHGDDIPTFFTFEGSGYGHGVGMSQVGARGQALEGRSATEILQYYFKDVAVEPVKDDQLIRVNIGHLLTNISLRTDTKYGQLQLFSGDIKQGLSAIPVEKISAKTNLVFTLLGSSIVPSLVKADGTSVMLESGSAWTIRWTGTRYLKGVPAVVGVKSGSTSMKYRYGQMNIKVVNAANLGSRIEFTNTLRLHDEYLWGIGEMPSSWPASALQAQVIASRSFALTRSKSLRSACACHLYASFVDQNFVGYSKELETGWGQKWRDAVNATLDGEHNGLAVTQNSIPIATYFFASSAGQTSLAEDVWGTPIAYVQSVPDLWSLDPLLNPKFFYWERIVSQEVMAQAFSLPDVVSVEILSRKVNGNVDVMLATSSTGQTAQLDGVSFKVSAKLPSRWFELAPPQMSEVPLTP